MALVQGVEPCFVAWWTRRLGLNQHLFAHYIMLLLESYCPTVRRHQHLLKRIFCTSTYHLMASSWLLVDLTMILICCCIGVASVHTLLCRKRKNQDTFDTLRYQLRYSPKLDGGTGGTQTHNLRLWMQVELLYVSFKWYLDRATIPEPPDYGVETKTWTWIFS